MTMQAREVLQSAVQEAEINLELEAAAEGRKPTAREYAEVILKVVNRDIEARVQRREDAARTSLASWRRSWYKWLSTGRRKGA